MYYNYTIPEYYYIKKKVRGIKGKLSSFKQRLDAVLADVKTVEPDEPYWHAHIPFDYTFIDSVNTPGKLRRSCVRIIIDAAEKLRTEYLADNKDCRVMAGITLPYMWSSQLLVFFSDEFYREYCTRNTPDQIWTPLDKYRNILAEWDLSAPASFTAKGYREEIDDEYSKYTDEVWFIGEV